MKRFLSLLVVMLLAFNIFLALEVQQLNVRVKDLSGSQSTHIVETKVTQFTTNVTEVVDKSLEKVVGIHSYRFNNLYSTGSGAVYKVNDNVVLIITNNHVISGADRVDIAFANGVEITGEVMGSDLFTDLALIKVVVDFEVVPFKVGDSALSKVGEWVLAIGSPLGNEFAGSVTMGILSGKDRVVPVDLDNNGIADWDMIVLQTDAAINPGNSGGPLINLAGELIGINSMKIAMEAVEGMGFAIPVNEVVPIMEQLEANGRVIRPVLGVSAVGISELSIYQKNSFGIQLNQTKGLYITSVVSGSPAQIAGILQGDIIVSFDNVEILNFKQFRKLLYGKKVNDLVDIVVSRDGELITARARLQ
jgi:serine protease Do